MRSFCIYGPPGTGKTTELVRLINETARRNPSAPLCFLSHTRVAAREAVRRGNCTLPVDNAMTLHSLCFRACKLARTQTVTTDKLVKFGDEIGMPISGASPDSERELTPADFMMAIYDLARARMQTPEEAYDLSAERPGTPAEFAYLIRSYESWKQNTGQLDFTDMLSQALQWRGELPYRAFFIDEAQDLSALQRQVLYRFIRDASLVYMAGDDDQAIFEWAGADPRGMPEFEERFEAQRKVLDASHRIPRAVHRLAESVIARVTERVPKRYQPREEEGVVERDQLYGLEFKAPLTMLYRDRSVRAPMEDHLQESLVPYRTTVGFPAPLQTKAGRAISMLHATFKGEQVPAETRVALEDRLTNAGALALAAHKHVGKFRWSDLVQIPARHVHYLDSVDLDAPPVTLSSIHSFKGAESDHVVLSNGMSARTYENLSKAPDQEHRIMYVGVTRAKHKLTIIDGDRGYDL